MDTVIRQNVLLKSGNGTVAIEDYDPKIHGPAVEETDEQYQARIDAKRVAAAPFHPPTTIANLQTFDTAALPVQVPQPPVRSGIAAPAMGQRVAVDPEAEPTAWPGAVRGDGTKVPMASGQAAAVHSAAQQANAAKARADAEAKARAAGQVDKK